MKFTVGDRVVIFNLPEDDPLNNKTGNILGIGLGKDGDPIGFAAYIVGLDEPIETHKAVLMVSSCLRKV